MSQTNLTEMFPRGFCFTALMLIVLLLLSCSQFRTVEEEGIKNELNGVFTVASIDSSDHCYILKLVDQEVGEADTIVVVSEMGRKRSPTKNKGSFLITEKSTLKLELEEVTTWSEYSECFPQNIRLRSSAVLLVDGRIAAESNQIVGLYYYPEVTAKK